ncbi:MAG TPA: indole-3-glycerol phosphate synthase TrpC [Candidatus Acidoferrales bacterium]|jgi:indole-3-glycerol phosphate synthase|nr:indole-3-glycerol phosphate synthase TrpC [Candidatus Acidoferrales bacterium]
MADVINSGSILKRIVETRREAIAHRKRVLPLVALKIAVEKIARPARDFAAALTRPGPNVIAELKKASPSRGVLREDYRPASLAQSLEKAGAAALSVLTEEEFFQGSLAHLKEARKAVAIPVLRKDFVVDTWQVWEARAAEADSFLLIAALLDDASLRGLLELGRDLGMEAVVEVHDRAELARALGARARIIGVNNRDLATFHVRLETSFELAEGIPEDCVAVSESGIRAHDDLERLQRAGFDAFLVGEHLMTWPDPGRALRALLAPASPGRQNSNVDETVW